MAITVDIPKLGDLPLGGIFAPIVKGGSSVSSNSDDTAVTKETWQALTKYTLLIIGILIVVLAIEKMPRIGAPLLVLIVMGMLLTATNKGLI